MAEKKNQHFVPKSYLRSFSTAPAKKHLALWLPRKNKLIPTASIKDQCSKSYLYGQDLKIENWLGYPDTLFSQIVKQISDKPTLTSELDQKLKFFWLVQQFRAEKSLRETVAQHDDLRGLLEVTSEGISEAEKLLGPPLKPRDIMEMSLSSGEKMQKVIQDLKGVLLFADPKSTFLTTDNPAISYNRLIMQRFPEHRNWGLITAGLFIYLPLTPHIAYLA